MKVLFRADSSERIGTGHVARSLALADCLRDRGASILFACRPLAGAILDQIKSRDFLVEEITAREFESGTAVDPVDPLNWMMDSSRVRSVINSWSSKPIDWLVVDHYGLDRKWETDLRPSVRSIMVVDDLANRAHDCDLILDQNMFRDMNDRYSSLVPRCCTSLLGPKYALLRNEFRAARANIRIRRGKKHNILVCFGGADLGNETHKVLSGLRNSSVHGFHIVGVIGAANPHEDMLKDLCSTMKSVDLYRAPTNMASLMADADLAVGAGGTMMWERACMTLPSIVSVLAPNQIDAVEYLASLGLIVNMGNADELSSADYMKAIDRISRDDLLRLSSNSAELVDGLGAIRVADVMYRQNADAADANSQSERNE